MEDFDDEDDFDASSLTSPFSGGSIDDGSTPASSLTGSTDTPSIEDLSSLVDPTVFDPSITGLPGSSVMTGSMPTGLTGTGSAVNSGTGLLDSLFTSVTGALTGKKPVNLGNYVKLPTVPVSASVSKNTIVYIIGGLLAVVLLFGLFSKKRY